MATSQQKELQFQATMTALSFTPMAPGIRIMQAVKMAAEFIAAKTRKGSMLPEAIHALTAAGADPVVVARLAVQAQRAYGADGGGAAMLALAQQRGAPLVARRGGQLPDDPRAGLALRLVTILDGPMEAARYALGRVAYDARLVRYPNLITDAHVRALRAALGV